MSVETLAALRELVQAAAVAAGRHPRCGAFGYIRDALRRLPPELRVEIGELPEHPEDDQLDGAAEVRRLTAENAELRRRMGYSSHMQLDLLSSIEVTR